MSRSRTKKIKGANNPAELEDVDLFYMDLREVKEALANKYEYLADRYEQQNFPKHKGIS